MRKAPNPRDFYAAFVSEWLIAMSGGLSAIFAAISFYVTSIAGKELFGAMAVVCLLVSSYRLWANENRKVLYAEGKLIEIGLDRCLGFVNCGFHLNVENGIFVLMNWHVIFENLSATMITYRVNRIWLESTSGQPVALEADSNPTNFINANRDIQYTCVVSNRGHALGALPPFRFRIGFELSYDNVPPIKARTTEQVIEITINSVNPISTTNRITLRSER